jgi:hypothetical protein
VVGTVYKTMGTMALNARGLTSSSEAGDYWGSTSGKQDSVAGYAGNLDGTSVSLSKRSLRRSIKKPFYQRVGY